MHQAGWMSGSWGLHCLAYSLPPPNVIGFFSSSHLPSDQCCVQATPQVCSFPFSASLLSPSSTRQTLPFSFCRPVWIWCAGLGPRQWEAFSMACNVDTPLPPAGNSCEYSLSIRIDVIAFLSSRCVPIILSSLRQLEWKQINYWLLHIIKHLWFGNHWREHDYFSTFTLLWCIPHFIFSCKSENEKIQPVVVVTVAPNLPSALIIASSSYPHTSPFYVLSGPGCWLWSRWASLLQF